MVFCHPCVIALLRNKVKWSKGESTFVSRGPRGYSNWEDAVMMFKSMKDILCACTVVCIIHK